VFDVDGGKHVVQDLYSKQPGLTLLYFIRRSGWPCAMDDATSLEGVLPDLEKHGIRSVIIGTSLPEEVKEMKQSLKLSPPVYTDPTGALYKSLSFNYLSMGKLARDLLCCCFTTTYWYFVMYKYGNSNSGMKTDHKEMGGALLVDQSQNGASSLLFSYGKKEEADIVPFDKIIATAQQKQS